MRILFLAKRHYTNKDALREKYGRIYQLPLQWRVTGNSVELALLDYHSVRPEYADVDCFPVHSLPIAHPLTSLRLWSLARRCRPDVVVASGDCFVGLIGLRLAHQMGAAFVFDAYDDYRTFGAYRAFLGWDAFGYLLGHADRVFYASALMATSHAHGSPWIMVPNGVDPALFQPMSMADSRSKFGIAKDQTLIGYFGSMEADRGVDDLVAAVGRLHSQDSSVRLMLSGGGSGRQRHQAAWVEDRGSVPHQDIPGLINACDVVVLPYRRGPAIDMVSSCKMAEYLFCARPIVATRVPSLTSNFLKQADELGRAIANPGDVTDLARAIAFQIENRIVASPPSSYSWRDIAATALGALM